MKWYFIRNKSNDYLSFRELLDSAARGQYRLKGFGRISTSDEEIDAYKSIALFHPHEEKIVTLLGNRDSGKGVQCPGGLWTGLRGNFIIKEIDSPRHVWTSKDSQQNQDKREI
ncbi:MAG: hypothetical protein ACFFED_15925 [Candidatus Thorarchaeota archaeon]